MIAGHEIGTEVKWNEDNDLVVGVIEAVYQESRTIELSGMLYEVKVNKHSPTYLISKSDGQMVVLPHNAVMRRHVNMHT